MSKGTIIYIGGFELPDKNAAANRVMANAKILKKLGYSIVFIGINKDPYNVQKTIYSSQNIEGFTSWSVAYPSTNKDWIKYLTSINLFRKVVNQHRDVKAVICYNYQAVAFERIRKYCKRNNIKVISDCTEWYGENEGSVIFKVIKYLDTAYRMKIINRKVDSLIVVSTFLAKYYNKQITAVIPTLINTNKVKQPVYRDNKVINLAYAGVPFRLGKPLKNRSLAKDRLDLAIKLLYSAYKKGNEFKFDIYGITEKQYLEVMPSDKFMLDELKNRVVFHGRKSNIEIQKNISRADFTLLIRDDNRMTRAGFPTKFTESIRCFVPVITTETSDLKEYLIEGKNGFFIDKNNEIMDLEKISEILSLKPDQIKEMKKYCFASDTFNLDNWLKEAQKIL